MVSKMEETKLTKEEYHIIERTMDNLCSEHLKGTMQYIHTIEHLPNDMKKKGRDFIKKQIDEWIKTHDTLKTISAKLELIRKSNT